MVKSMRSCLSRPDAMRMMSGNVSECVGAIDKAFGHRFGHGCYIGAHGGAHDGDWYRAPWARVTTPQVAQVDGMLVLREYYNSTTQLSHARDDPAEINACEGGHTAQTSAFDRPRSAPTLREGSLVSSSSTSSPSNIGAGAAFSLCLLWLVSCV